MADDPDSTQKRELTIHSQNDVDFIDLKINDTGLGGNPTINVTVSPEGFEVTMRLSCSDAQVQCIAGKEVQDPELGTACTSVAGAGPANVRSTTECNGTSNDGGPLRIRIRRVNAKATCDRYTLTVGVT